MVVCSWDGTTYLIDQEMNLVEFQFEDQVSAFTAGKYAIGQGKSVPCLIYVTFFDEIFVYHNITSMPLFGPIEPVKKVDPDIQKMSLQELKDYKASLQQAILQLEKK